VSAEDESGELKWSKRSDESGDRLLELEAVLSTVRTPLMSPKHMDYRRRLKAGDQNTFLPLPFTFWQWSAPYAAKWRQWRRLDWGC